MGGECIIYAGLTFLVHGRAASQKSWESWGGAGLLTRGPLAKRPLRGCTVVGAGPSHGHYICLVRSHKHWLLFDDDTVDLVEEGSLQSCFGSALEPAEVL